MTTFADLKLIAPIQKAITAEKYETPTPIQEETIPQALAGRDILGCAQTGTGKTAAFALPILNHLGKRNQKAVPNTPRVLVLAPTRELALQIHESIQCYGRNLRLRSAVVYGGVSQHHQVRSLERGVHILIATPGRLLDLINQGYIELGRLDIFVLDEADRMLDMGFLPDLKRIIAELPEKRQSLFFSATMAPKIAELADALLKDPVRITISPKTTTADSVDHRVLFVERHQKRERLRKILDHESVARAIVFVRTKRGADVLSKQLTRDGIHADALHGNKSQNARQRTLASFRDAKLRVLVATDVAARGIDIDDITHVVNFELPNDPENYVHRIGRTGRAGSSGIAVSLCDSSERTQLRAIETLIKQKIPVQGPAAQGRDNSSPKGKLPEAARTESKPTTDPQATDRPDGPRRRRRRPSRKGRRPVSASATGATR